MTMNIDHFVSAYVRSMRLDHAFIIGIAGWTGLACYYFSFPEQIHLLRVFVILSLLILVWGSNQVLIDYLDFTEKCSNASHHPMPGGNLPPTSALVVTVLLLVLVLIAAFKLNPLAIIPLLFGVLLTLLYRHAKKIPVAGNLVLLIIIAVCPIFCFLAAGPGAYPFLTTDRIALLLLLVSINAILIPYASFNNDEINKAAQPPDAAERYSISQLARFCLWTLTFLLILMAVFVRSNMMPPKDLLFVPEFLLLAGATLFLQWWAGCLGVYRLQGSKKHFNMVIKLRACVAGNCTMMAIFNARLAILLLLASYILIEFLFISHKNARA